MIWLIVYLVLLPVIATLVGKCIETEDDGEWREEREERAA